MPQQKLWLIKLKQYFFNRVVNNVAIVYPQPLEEVKLDKFEAVIDLNLPFQQFLFPTNLLIPIS